jgi:hypothetical protein
MVSGFVFHVQRAEIVNANDGADSDCSPEIDNPADGVVDSFHGGYLALVERVGRSESGVARSTWLGHKAKLGLFAHPLGNIVVAMVLSVELRCAVMLALVALGIQDKPGRAG